MQNFGFSERFHWTPEQIESLSDDDRAKYICIMKGQNDAQEKAIKKK